MLVVNYLLYHFYTKWDDPSAFPFDRGFLALPDLPTAWEFLHLYGHRLTLR